MEVASLSRAVHYARKGDSTPIEGARRLIEERIGLGAFAAVGPGNQEGTMSGTIINLIIQLIAGAIGGNAVGAAAKNVNLGTAGNTVAGAVGGVAGGSLLTSLIPMLSGRRPAAWMSAPLSVSWSAAACRARSCRRSSAWSSTT